VVKRKREPQWVPIDGTISTRFINAEGLILLDDQLFRGEGIRIKTVQLNDGHTYGYFGELWEGRYVFREMSPPDPA
jgi:hypothetical protein